MSRKTHRWDDYRLLITTEGTEETFDAGKVNDCYIIKGVISFVTAQGTFQFSLRDGGKPHRQNGFYGSNGKRAVLTPPKQGGQK